MIYIATFTYIQNVDDVGVQGNFQIVGEVLKTSDDEPRVIFLTKHALSKLKRLAESDDVDFSGETTFFLDSLVEFPSSSDGIIKSPFVVNMATTLGGDVNFAEVPLNEDTDLVTVHRSTQIGIGSKAIYMHPPENPSS